MKINYYTLLYYPKYKDNKVEDFRKKYDKNYKDWNSHITLIFPISDNEINETELINHIQNVLKNFKSFEIHIKGLTKSWDHWLFIILEEGNNKVTKLHDELYTGPLKKFLRDDIEFIPHIAIGHFSRKSDYNVADPKRFKLDKETYNMAHKEAKKFKFDYRCNVDKLVLEKFDQNFKHAGKVKEFRIK